MRIKTMTAFLLICLFAISCITTVCDAEDFSCAWYSLTLPSALWTTDTVSAANENTNEYRWIGTLCEGGTNGLYIDMEMSYISELSQYRLFAMDDDQILEYAQMVIQSMESVSELIYSEIVYSNNKHIPFVVFSGTDPDGTYYYAETVTNGWVISFCAYAYADENYERYRPITKVDYQKLTYILNSFTPLKVK